MGSDGAPGSLLDPAFVRALGRLRLEVRRRMAGARAGERRSTRRGASVEFAEHRPYAPGDDPRRIDWNAYARLGDLVLRLFVAEEDVTLYLILDASASMAGKLDVARRVAAGLGYLALTGNERVSVSVCGAGTVGRADALRGRKRLPELLAGLDGVRPGGGADLGRAVDGLLAGRARAGVAVVITDAYEDERVVRAARKLASARHEVTLVHTLGEAELAPEASGEATLVDAESGEALDLTLDAEAVGLYRARLEKWSEGIERQCRAAGVRYVRAFGAREAFDVVAEAVAR